MKTDRPEELRVPVSTLRRVCGDDQGVIQRLVQSRQLPVRDGTTPLVSGIRAFLDAIRTEARNASLSRARDEARDARAAAVELDLACDLRELILDEDADNALLSITGAIVREIAVVAARTTRDMRLRRVIDTELYAAQAAIADEVAALDGALGPVAKPAQGRKRKGRSR